AKAFGGDDIGWGTAGIEHGREYFFPAGGSDLTGLDKFQEFGKGCEGNRAGFNFLPGVVQSTQKFCLNPVGGSLRGSAGFYDRFKIIGEWPRGCQHAGVVWRQAMSGDEAGALCFG